MVEDELVLTKGHVLANLPKLYREYEVKLEVMVFSLPTHGGSHSLLHLTISGNSDKHGSRNPGMWISSANPPVFWIATGLGTNKNWYKEYKETQDWRIPTNTWIAMTVDQQFKHGAWMFTITIEGCTICTYAIENTLPVDLTNVKVYASDPWHPPLNGSIRRLEISTRGRHDSILF